MAKNVKLTWTNPATIGDIDTIDLYRKVGDHTAVTDMAVFRSGATLVSAEAITTGANNSQDYTESNVAAETYTYGAFSKNAGGYGPGDLTDSVIVVT